MKLISNFKDYYDHMIGTYGIDELCVYKRICSTEGNDSQFWKSGVFNPDFQNEIYRSFEIHFCGTVYYGHYYKGKFYYGENASEIPTIIKNKTSCINSYRRGKVSNSEKSNLNDEYNCPVILMFSYYNEILNPKLSDFGFGKVIDPDIAFKSITNFLMKEKEINSIQTDKEKIVSHGFDLKSSFRNIK